MGIQLVVVSAIFTPSSKTFFKNTSCLLQFGQFLKLYAYKGLHRGARQEEIWPMRSIVCSNDLTHPLIPSIISLFIKSFRPAEKKKRVLTGILLKTKVKVTFKS